MSTDAVAKSSSQYPFGWRRLAGASLLVGAAFAAGLVATAPADAVRLVVDMPPQVIGLTGTLWQGQAVLADGLSAGWQIDVPGSFRAGNVVLDWSLTGQDTRLSGRAALTRGSVSVTAVSGVAGWSLTDAIGAMPITCDLNARVELDEATAAPGTLSARGSLSTPPGTCQAEGAPPLNIPALAATITPVEAGIRIVFEQRDRPGDTLGSVELLAEGRLIATLQPAGAKLVPGMPSSAPSMIEMPVTLPAALTAPPPPER